MTLPRQRRRVDAAARSFETQHVRISYRLCPLSEKRRAMLEEDPGLVSDLDPAEIADVVDLGPEGFELAGILLFTGRDSVVREAVFAHTGQVLGVLGEGARIHAPERVAVISAALEALPEDVIARHYEQARRAIPKLARGPGEVARFSELHLRLRTVYVSAAAKNQSLLTFMV